MPFSGLETKGVARCLAQAADQKGDIADAFFERLEEVELPPSDVEAGTRIRREEGLAVRLVRKGCTWLAARDAVTPDSYVDALRQIARAQPVAAYPSPGWEIAPFEEPDDPAEMAEFPRAVTRRIRQDHAAFPLRLTIRRHRRWLKIVGTQLAPDAQSEEFYSCSAELPWGRYGAVLSDLGADAVERVAGSLVALFRARDASSVSLQQGVVILGPAATAVLLHEVVSHALEADTLVLGGKLQAALGVHLGSELLNVLDDPQTAPEGVRRTFDDEGMTVIRRWLLRSGVVQQPLADRFTAQESRHLTPGAGRRGSRHLPPAPRSTHLEIVPGDSSLEDLLTDAEGGLYVPEAARGRLEPLSGRFWLYLPFGHRIVSGQAQDLVGPCRLEGTVSELLAAVRGVGKAAESAGAGWCVKGGLKLAVWATSPALRAEAVEVKT